MACKLRIFKEHLLLSSFHLFRSGFEAHCHASSEERGSKEVRARAQAALQDMTPKNMFRCGLTCDYSTECLAFLRENFDVDDPDPAQTSGIVDAFCQRMRLLFVEGYVLGDAKQVPLASDGQNGRSMTLKVFEQIETPEPSLISS